MLEVLLADFLGILELLKEFVNILLDLIKEVQNGRVVHLGIAAVRNAQTIQVFHEFLYPGVLLGLNLLILLVHGRALHELALLLSACLAFVDFLEALGEDLDLSLHLALKLIKLVLFGLPLLFGVLTLLDKEEVFLL